MQPIYHDCGQFYFFWVDNFMKTGSVVDKAKPLIISEMEVQDKGSNVHSETAFKNVWMAWRTCDNLYSNNMGNSPVQP